MATSAITAYGGIRTVTVSTEITVTSTPVTIMLNWPSPPISQSIQYTSLASPNDLASSKYFLRPIPLFVLTEIDGVVVDTGGMPITTVTKLQSVPTDVYFATGNIDGAAAVADCSGNEWACWNAGKKVGVVIGSVFAFLFSVLIILCYCCAMRRRRHELSDGEIEMGDRRGSSSPAPNVVSQFSKRRPKDSKSAPRTGYPRPVRVKKPWIIPLPDVKDTSRGLTWPQGAGLMDNISNFRTQRRGGFISGRNCQVYREDPFRLSREPIIQATGRRAANSSRRDPLRAPRDGVPRECAIQGAGRDFERQTEQRDRVYRSRRGVSIHDPYRNSSTRGQVQQAPFSKRKLLSTDVSPSLDSTSIGGRSSPLPDRRDKWLGKRRRLAPRRRKYKWRSVLLHLLLPALLVVEELTEPANGWEQYHQKNQRRPSQHSPESKRQGLRSSTQGRPPNRRYSNKPRPQQPRAEGRTSVREPALMSGGLRS